jgi:ATP-dependent Lon protease
MRESAEAALSWVRANADRYQIDSAALRGGEIHLHVPAGAVPKDGPSAGVALATAILSALSGRRALGTAAMTGEISLRGRVLPVGGIKEKILAAKRAGIKEIIISEDNRKDIEDIDARYLRGMRFHYVTEMIDVVKHALLKEKVEHALLVA